MKMSGVTAKETMLVGDSIRRDKSTSKGLEMFPYHGSVGPDGWVVFAFSREDAELPRFIIPGTRKMSENLFISL
jgi:hypothetical protein